MDRPRQSYFGQGPRMIRPAVIVAVIGGLAAWFEPDIFLLSPRLLQPLRGLLGWMFILAGTGLFVWGMARMIPAVKSGTFDTGGPFAIVRNPMYSAWIVFLFPGIALTSGAWLILGASPTAWIFFRKWVLVEEQALLDRFGQPYAQYRKKVPALFPFPQ